MERIWEIDFARGLAVVLMVFFNYAFALKYLGIYAPDAGWLFWWLFPRAIGGAFVFIAGVSVTLSRNKDRAKLIRRGLKIFALGMAITLATWLAVPADAVVFGVLHLIGISVILSALFMKTKAGTLAAAGLASAAVGALAGGVYYNTGLFFWAGLMPAGFRTLDYFPLAPWFGIFLLGMAAGKTFYGSAKPAISKPGASGSISFIGRHSLLIYIAHIPVLIAALYLTGLL